MSDEETPAEAPQSKSPPKLRPENQLSKSSDQALRPGFRNPPNRGSKAMKSKKKKKP